MCLRLFYLEKMEKAKKLMEEELSISEICILLLQTQGNSTIQLKMGSILFLVLFICKSLEYFEL